MRRFQFNLKISRGGVAGCFFVLPAVREAGIGPLADGGRGGAGRGLSGGCGRSGALRGAQRAAATASAQRRPSRAAETMPPA